jgi:hypothetical protein
MLSALLNSIQSTLGSRGFLVSNVFPVAMFAIANGVIAAQIWPSFEKQFASFDAADKTLLATAGVAAVIVASYVMSALASAILETFEGRHWPVTWFRAPLHRLQLARLRELEARYNACLHGLSDVMDGIDGDPHMAPPLVSWIALLRTARLTGQAAGKRQYSYPATSWQRVRWRYRQWRRDPCRPDVGIAEMSAVRRRRESGREIPAGMLRDAVHKLVMPLSMNAADGAVMATAPKRALDADCDYLIEAIYFSRDRYQAERIRLYNLRKFQFPVGGNAAAQLSSIILAPTALGNISRTMRSYAHNYYGFDLDVLWTRLQNALRTSDPYFTSLQDAKVQLDFFAACAWLSWISTFTWLALELFIVRSSRGFVVAGVVGPTLAFASYVLACRAYNVFADIMRTGVDLFRFKVLSDLHLPLPLGLEEERIAWRNLAGVMGYLNLQDPDGSAISVTYKHGP